VLRKAALPLPKVLFSLRGFQEMTQEWLGDRHPGKQDASLLENKGIAGLPPEVLGPRGRYLTGLVEPCGALPRKCLFKMAEAPPCDRIRTLQSFQITGHTCLI
jgi:hypothetical protein